MPNLGVAIVAAVTYYRRVDPMKSIIEIEDVSAAIGQIGQTTVRNVVGRSQLDQVLTDTETLSQRIKEILIADHPVALQLRNLQILAEIAAEKNSTIIFPAQFLESVKALRHFAEQESAPATADTSRAFVVPDGDGKQRSMVA